MSSPASTARPGVQFRGGNAALWFDRSPEILVEGAAGTGKTFSILAYLWTVAELYPGARILLTRRERTRITRSVLVTFERDVVEWAKIVNRKVTREHRHTYQLTNGSEFIVQGAEDIQALLSQEYDLAYWNEVTEQPTLEAFEALHRALRSGPVPWRQLIADCNPNRPTHWILKRCERGITRRIKTFLHDNPLFHDGITWTDKGIEYRSRLGTKLTGVQYKRLFLGEWCAAEGLVLPRYGEHEQLFRPAPPPLILGRDGRMRRDWRLLGSGIRFWFGAVDWGTRKPGVLQVWGKDQDGRLFRVAEVYRTERDVNWWARTACELVSEFDRPETPFVGIVADSAGKDQIMVFNAALQERGFRTVCHPCEKDYEANLDLVRAGFDPENPRLFLVQDSTRGGRDPALDEHGSPCSTEEELLLLTYPDHVDKPGRAKDEQHDQSLEDHGFDAMLYGVGWAMRRELGVALPAPKFEAGSAGDILGHAKKWERMRRRGVARERYE